MACKLVRHTNRLQDLRNTTQIGKRKGKEGGPGGRVNKNKHVLSFSCMEPVLSLPCEVRILINILINKNTKVITHPKSEDCYNIWLADLNPRSEHNAMLHLLTHFSNSFF